MGEAACAKRRAQRDAVLMPVIERVWSVKLQAYRANKA